MINRNDVFMCLCSCVCVHIHNSTKTIYLHSSSLFEQAFVQLPVVFVMSEMLDVVF